MDPSAPFPHWRNLDPRINVWIRPLLVHMGDSLMPQLKFLHPGFTGYEPSHTLPWENLSSSPTWHSYKWWGKRNLPVWPWSKAFVASLLCILCWWYEPIRNTLFCVLISFLRSVSGVSEVNSKVFQESCGNIFLVPACAISASAQQYLILTL